MTGPLIEFAIRQVNPLDTKVSAVRYDIQTSFPGPLEFVTGPYVYREARTDMVRTDGLFKDTSITQTLAYGSSFPSTIAFNFVNADTLNLDAFYERASTNAKAYFANIYGTQSIKGYTGSSWWSGPGISGSYYSVD